LSEFTDAVERELRGIVGVNIGRAALVCPNCERDTAEDPHDDGEWEPWFSWSDCDGCGSTYGGDRSPAHGFVKMEEGGEEIIHLEVCADCVQYIANGEEPDEWTSGP
jgi:hypothetical protein